MSSVSRARQTRPQNESLLLPALPIFKCWTWCSAVPMSSCTLVLLFLSRMVGNGSVVGVLGGRKLDSRGSNGE